MRKSLLVAGLSLALWGCSPLTDETPRGTNSPLATPTRVATAAPPPAPSHSPAVELLHPDVPRKATEALKPLPVLKPAMAEREVWYIDSGIRDNGLDYYASEKDVKDVEAELSAALADPDFQPFLPELGPVFDFEGLRISITTKGEMARMFVLAPLGDPPRAPEALRRLKLPKVDLSKVDMKGKKTLVVLASGKGLARAVDHSLAEAGLSVTASPTATATATETPDSSPTP